MVRQSDVVVLVCRVRAIFYGGLRWTPWTPWGSWLWPARPVDSPPPLPPTPHPPPSQQSITTPPPTPSLAAGAACTATGASDASAVGVNVEKQKEDALSSDQIIGSETRRADSLRGTWERLWRRCWAQCECVLIKLWVSIELMKDRDDWPALKPLDGFLLICERKPASAQSYGTQERGMNTNMTEFIWIKGKNQF